MSRWTEAEYKEHLVKRMREPKPSKYKAVKTTVDGITFDSKKEAQRWHELNLQQRAGLVRRLKRQPVFPLYAFTSAATDPVLIGSYRADFDYEEWTGDTPATPRDSKSLFWVPVTEDVKGMKTAMYRWKKKHVEAQYGIQIRET